MALTRESILELFRETEALLEGHFILTSGLHSNRYFQCARVLQYPWHAEALCHDLAARLPEGRFEAVVSPAVGGILVGQEIARALRVRSVFTERQDGRMTFRRGFAIRPGESVLVAEDVTTTGGSVMEVIEAVRGEGGAPAAVAAIVDRSGGKAAALFGLPYSSLLQMDVETYPPDDCPLCRSGSRAVKPGSRGLK
jgi:orotate phosphoribosyltransferase